MTWKGNNTPPPPSHHVLATGMTKITERLSNWDD